MAYEIETRTLSNKLGSEWTSEIGDDDANEFASEADALAMIEELKTLGEDSPAAEYRVVPKYPVIDPTAISTIPLPITATNPKIHRAKEIWGLHSIGHGLDISTGILYPMKESGGYDLENGCPFAEADDLSMLSQEDERKARDLIGWIKFKNTLRGGR